MAMLRQALQQQRALIADEADRRIVQVLGDSNHSNELFLGRTATMSKDQAQIGTNTPLHRGRPPLLKTVR